MRGGWPLPACGSASAVQSWAAPLGGWSSSRRQARCTSGSERATRITPGQHVYSVRAVRGPAQFVAAAQHALAQLSPISAGAHDFALPSFTDHSARRSDRYEVAGVEFACTAVDDGQLRLSGVHLDYPQAVSVRMAGGFEDAAHNSASGHGRYTDTAGTLKSSVAIRIDQTNPLVTACRCGHATASCRSRRRRRSSRSYIGRFRSSSPNGQICSRLAHDLTVAAGIPSHAWASEAVNRCLTPPPRSACPATASGSGATARHSPGR
jgi:hypothetical protein